MNNPRHIAIIPDGNRRWARKQGLRVVLGHDRGAEVFGELLEVILREKIPYITFWGSSTSNVLNRSAAEVTFYFALVEKYFKKLLEDKRLAERKVRVRMLGRWRELFPESLKAIMEELIATTVSHDEHHLTFLMAYSGVEEMVDTMNRISDAKAKDPASTLDAPMLKSFLWTHDLPPVDLVIRTGGEPHWSQGFMMWDVAEAQLVFTETLWPDFAEKEFLAIIAEYANRERRFGK